MTTAEDNTLRWARLLGWVAMIGGSVLAFIGGLAAYIALPGLHTVYGPDPYSQCGQDFVRTTGIHGIVALLAGLLLLRVGASSVAALNLLEEAQTKS